MASIAVIGGGIIGSAAAAWLIADGRSVTVFERDPEGRPASTGNAGLISLPSISPLARPGIFTSVPGWLLDPTGPLSLRLQDLPALTPWLLRFVASARPHKVEQATRSLSFIMKTALADHQELARRAGLSGHMHRTGSLHLYDSPASYRSGLVEWKERARHGVDFFELTDAGARELVPAFVGPFHAAVHAPESWTASSPLEILQGLRRAVSTGGNFRAATVDTLRPTPGGVVVATSDGDTQVFDRAVVAGGVWSRDLVGKLGLRVILETERGYNTTWPDPPVEVPVPTFFEDHGFVASQLNDGLRVGGAVELADVDAPPNFARAAAMRAKMRRYVPDLPETGGREWMGCRPSTPDSLPVIGPHPRDSRVVFAFGHGHLGLTLSAATARHVAELIAGRPRDRNLEPFGIERFQ
jgi:D-amino-acid dehydrogenase